MKEFHIALSKSTNNAQFAQLCKDAFTEIKIEGRGRIDSMEVFNRYYNLNFTLLQLSRMGQFIESGKFKDELKAYGKI